MKSAIVPAQITTVEDRIAGNLTWQQLFLLAMPVLVDFMIYVIVPQSLQMSVFKVMLMVVVAVFCGVSAIRIRGKILLVWAATIIRYNTRPRYYVFNKNDIYLRASIVEVAIEPLAVEQESEPVMESLLPVTEISMADAVKLEGILANPAANLSFKSRKKGGLHVSITEIK